ncbi:MAG: tRNA uridine-5-carboxymethylaminomethyl(34) synthesis GTPase MnmE [Bacteroidales bacterium]|nr:tRNA uridine-5-carboxymethylaminomethyl(34) synthesis GTPase MnmE [Bacteroidales bacterium]
MQTVFDDTICAPATATGGALAIVRVSGPNAVAKVAERFRPARRADGTPGPKLTDASGFTLHYGTVCDGETVLDEVVAAVYRGPRSYTGEDCVEISCHGSPYIVERMLELLTASGVRMAAPGEFTQRAFLAGKMDLAQAEAVADVIASQTAAAHRVALNQLRGGFSDRLSEMRDELLEIASLIELELDFGEEDVEFADRKRLGNLLSLVRSHIGRLIESFRLGNAIKNGVPVAIVGKTNAGKSTLLNALLGEDRAIVSEIPGTTRDTIEETFNIEGTLYRLIDTAGLRESDDRIEQIGISRALEKLSSAQIVIGMLDLTAPLPDLTASAWQIADALTAGQQLILWLNKADAVTPEILALAQKSLTELTAAHEAVLLSGSAKQGAGLEDLRKSLSDIWGRMGSASESVLVTNTRHLEALRNANDALGRVESGMGNVPTDLLAQDLREALYHIGSITGQVTTDEILGNIFRNFCIGK